MFTFENRMNKKYLFIIISALALFGVLVIQVNWIVKAAHLKEEIFNEKAKIVLAKTSDAIGNNPVACKEIGKSLEEDTPNNKSQFDEIDSLFHHYMAFYKIDMDYSYEIVSPNPEKLSDKFAAHRTFNQEFDIVSFPNNISLKLIFPDRSQFLFAEMGVLFFTSIGLILAVLFFFFLTIKNFVREKAIAEQTSEFLNNMTHEFKTPLTNIGLATKMIGKKVNETQAEQISVYTDIIQFEKTKLSLQVEQVLGIASLEKRETLIALEKISFHSTINKAIKIMALQLQEKQGSLQLNLVANPDSFNGDETHLLNAICNLIDNAIKYSLECPQIEISTTNYNFGIQFKITDQGIGIDKHHQNNIFDKYYRVQKGNIHDVKGFGIGLAYVKQIVALHQGEINLSSEKNVGSCFTIRIPYD